MTPKKTSYVLVFVLLAVICLGVYAFYYGDNVIKQRSEEISLEKANLEAVETELSIYQDSKKKVEEYGFILDLIDKIIPENKLQSEVIAELNSFATDSNMQITTLTFGSGDATNTEAKYSQTETKEGLAGVRVLSAAIQFEPIDENTPILFNDALSFLDKIEDNQRKWLVTDLSLTPQPDNGNILTSVSMSVDIFLRGGQQ